MDMRLIEKGMCGRLILCPTNWIGVRPETSIGRSEVVHHG